MDRARVPVWQIGFGRFVLDFCVLRAEASAAVDRVTDPSNKSDLDNFDRDVMDGGKTFSQPVDRNFSYSVGFLCVLLRRFEGRDPFRPRPMGWLYDDCHVAWFSQRVVRQIPSAIGGLQSSDNPSLVFCIPCRRDGAADDRLVRKATAWNAFSVALADTDHCDCIVDCGLLVLYSDC